MALKALPILFYNLGGEMLYVLDQRLVAQKIASDKASKVVADIVDTMFNLHSLKEMEKHQVLYSKQAMRTIFTKLVHSSIMKVNNESMEKLFDLMLMAVKHQFIQCNCPLDILHVTLNHLDSILASVARNNAVALKVKSVFQRIVEVYGSMSPGEFVMLKQSLLTFLQDSNNKVSIYLTSKIQNDEGRFVIFKSGEVPPGSDVPGTIRLYKTGKGKPIKFDSGTSFQPHVGQYDVSNEISGKRCTHLGTNIYKDCHSSDYIIATGSFTSVDSNRLAQAELGLLAQLIGTNECSSSDHKEFKLQLFSSNDDIPIVKSSTSTVSSSNVVNIVPTKSTQGELSKIVDDLTISSSSKKMTRGEDLLSLMDS